jgi:hypothetical protein
MGALLLVVKMSDSGRQFHLSDDADEPEDQAM